MTMKMVMRRSQLLIPLGVAVLGFIAGALTAGSRLTNKPLPFPGDGSQEAGARNTVTPKGAQEDDPMAAIMGTLGEPDSLKQFAALSQWMDRLGTSEMRDLLERLRHSRMETHRDLLPAVLAYLASRDPAAATDWIRPYLNDPSRVPSFSESSRLPNFEACLKSWARAAPKYALEVARENQNSDWCNVALGYAIRALKESPAERLKILSAFHAGEVPYWRTQDVITEWARENPDGAFAAAKALPPGKLRDASIAAVLKKQFAQNPDAALLQAEALDVQNLPVLGGLLMNVANADPATAVRWLEKRDPALETTLVEALLMGWSERDPIAALNWAWQQDSRFETGDAASRKPLLGSEQLQRVLKKNTAATVDWLKQLPSGEKRDQLLEIAAYFVPNATDAIPLLSEASGEVAANMARDIIARMVDNDPNQAEQWATGFPLGPIREAAWEGIGRKRSEPLPIPPGPDRDAMLSGMAIQIGNRTEPQKIANWVLEIENPILRRRAFEDAMTLWPRWRSSGQAQALREWLQNAPVPAEWKEKWLK